MRLIGTLFKKHSIFNLRLIRELNCRELKSRGAE